MSHTEMQDSATRFDDRAVSDDATLSIKMMGPICCTVGAETVQPANRKSRALLGYLAANETGEESRERLVGLLWSEVPEHKARGSLRQAIREIRKALEATPFSGFYADKLVVRLDRAKTSVDLWDFIDSSGSRQPHRILLDTVRPFDDLLAEFETVTPEFRQWLVARRQSLSERTMRRLELTMRRSSTQPADRMMLARAIMNIDPTHEEAARTLILELSHAGDIGGAFQIYRRLWHLLEEEYDVEPSKETQDLIAALRLEQPPARAAVTDQVTALAGRGSVPMQQPVLRVQPLQPAIFEEPVAAAPAGRKLIINVAAFESTSVHAEDRYLVEGFRRELIACLVRFREWMICDGAFASPGRADRGGAQGEYVIETSAFADIDSVRLALTLREIPTGIYLWSERLQLSTENWLRAQQLVIRRLTSALNVHLSAGRLKALVPGPGEDLRAYDQWLRGHALLFDWSPKSWHMASEVFEGIIARSPTFAPAYSSLAQLQNNIHFVHPGVFRDMRRTAQALSYAREATKLDPIDSKGHLCLGWAYATANQHAHAELHHEIACELNDNDPWTVVSAGLGSAFRGHMKRAKTLADNSEALALAPTPAHWRYQSMIRYLCDEHEASVTAADRAGTSVPNVLIWKAAALVRLGRIKDANAAAGEFFRAVQSKWFGERSPTPNEISRWILSAFPIEKPEIWERLRDDLGRAGAPVDGISCEYPH